MAKGAAKTTPQQQMMQAMFMQKIANPTTTLPAGMQPTAPQALTPQQIGESGLSLDQTLPTDLRITNDNPVFAPDASTQYRDEYFRQAIQPQIDRAAVDSYLTGNFGNSNSTFGSTFLSNLTAQGANQAFFAGEDFRNNRVNEVINRRNSFFGNNANIAQQQNQTDINRALNLNNETSNRLNALNQFNLGSAGLLSNNAQNLYEQQFMADQARTQNLGGLLGGLVGTGFGLYDVLKGRPTSSSSSKSYFAAPQISFLGRPLGAF